MATKYRTYTDNGYIEVKTLKAAQAISDKIDEIEYTVDPDKKEKIEVSKTKIEG